MNMHDRPRTPAAPSPSTRSTARDEAAKNRIYRQHLQGVPTEALANQLGRAGGALNRGVNVLGANRLREQKIEAMPHDSFDDPASFAVILQALTNPVDGKAPRKVKSPEGVPPYLASLYDVPLLSREQEAHLFRKMNFLKYRALKLRDTLDPLKATTTTLDEIDRQAAQLLTQLHSLPPLDPDRTHFLILELHAIQTRTAMLRGHLLPFDAEAQALFHTSRLPDTEAAARAALLQHISAMLPPSPQSAPSRDTLASRYAAYDQRFLVPPAKLAAVMQAALAGCRQQTLKYITLPPSESVQLIFTRNQPWSAFSRYEGHAHSTLLLNLDLPVTVDGALELACHEGSPGHHVFNSLHDAALVQRDHHPEAQAQLTFSPQAYVSEAAAAYAPRLAFSLDQRIAFERDVLFPLAGLNPVEADRHVRLSRLLADLSSAQPAIARDFLDGHLEFIHAEDELARQTLMLHAEAVLLYLNEYRSYMLAYTDGPRRMERFLNQPTPQPEVKPDPRTPWDRLVQLAESEHIDVLGPN